MRRLKYEHNGQVLEVEVGKPLPDHYQEAVPMAIAILGGSPLLVCTRDRGVARGRPVYVGAQSVIEAEYFDADEC